MGNTVENGDVVNGESVQVEFGPWLQGFTFEIESLASNDSRPLSAAWATSVKQSRFSQENFVELLEDFHHQNPGATPPEALRRLLSSEQATLLSAQSDGQLFYAYPSEAYDDHRVWQNAYTSVVLMPPYSVQYGEHLKRRLATPESQRMVAVRFLGRVLSHITGPEPQWASCGSSDMSGDKRNWLSERYERFRFDRVAVLEPRALGGLAVSEEKSDTFNRIVTDSDDTRRVVCLDRTDPYEPANMAWAQACPTPEEILSGDWASLHDALMRADVPSEWLGFRVADISRRSDMEAVVKDEGSFDGTSALFSWYQGVAAERRRKLRNMLEVLLRPGGVGIVADFARRAADTQLRPLSTWSNPNVFVGHEGKLYHVLSFDNGRFRKVRILPELAELASHGPYAKEVRELLA